MRSTYGVHVIWCHLFSNLLSNSPISRDLSCDYTITLWLMWQHDWSTLTLVVLKIEKWKINQKENKMRKKNKINKVYFLQSWHLSPFHKLLPPVWTVSDIELKSTVIFIYFHYLIILFKHCKITQTLYRVFSFPSLNFYLVFYYWNTCLEICFDYFFCYFIYLRLVITL